jgi:hypothetical protein
MAQRPALAPELLRQRTTTIAQVPEVRQPSMMAGDWVSEETAIRTE